jgi:hypothetical protein
MKDKEKQIEFKVIDNNTGKEADIGKIALKEDWAKGLMYCDMQGFAILDDGNLVLLDECGKFEYCPSERFSIKFEDSVVLSMEEYDNLRLQIQQAHNKGVKVGFDLTKLKENSIEIANKETAKRFYKKVRKLLKKVDIIVDGDEGLIGYEESAVDKGLTELAKQFGVEIKE